MIQTYRIPNLPNQCSGADALRGITVSSTRAFISAPAHHRNGHYWTPRLAPRRELLQDNVQVASLDHAMWFHRPFRADEWLLYDQIAPAPMAPEALIEVNLQLLVSQVSIKKVGAVHQPNKQSLD